MNKNLSSKNGRFDSLPSLWKVFNLVLNLHDIQGWDFSICREACLRQKGFPQKTSKWQWLIAHKWGQTCTGLLSRTRQTVLPSSHWTERSFITEVDEVDMLIKEWISSSRQLCQPSGFDCTKWAACAKVLQHSVWHSFPKAMEATYKLATNKFGTMLLWHNCFSKSSPRPWCST